MAFPTMRVSAVAGIAMAAILAMTACAPGVAETAPPSSASTSASPTATPTATPTRTPPPTADPPSDTRPRTNATNAFLAWLAASRVPDTATACAGLAPELATRMIAEINERTPVRVGSCEEMITATAELYRALDQSADVSVAVQQETDTEATLFVTYQATGNCGTVAMRRSGTGWIITEQSKECARCGPRPPSGRAW